MIENNCGSYASISVHEAMSLAGHGVYHECDADLMTAIVADYDLEEFIAYASRR